MLYDDDGDGLMDMSCCLLHSVGIHAVRRCDGDWLMDMPCKHMYNKSGECIA